MALGARWIRLGLAEPLELCAAYGGLAAAQARHAAPILLWAQAKSAVVQGLARAQEFEYVFALIAPRRLAPGRRTRWRAWALAPAIAAYRHFGLRAYLSGDEAWLNGRRISQSGADAIGECVVVASNLLATFPGPRLAGDRAAHAVEFRAWLREGAALAASEWVGDGAAPAQRELEAVLRARVEAQHGWQFENSWPSASERAAIGTARVRLCAQPVEAVAP